MKEKFRKFLIKLFNPIAIRLGFIHWSKIDRQRDAYAKNSLLDTFFSNICEIGFVPKHIIDVGANHGTWTRESLKFFPDAFYTLIEPQEWLKSSVQDLIDSNSKITFNPYGAGAENGSMMLTIADRDDSCTFRFTEEEAKARGNEQIEVSIVTLNEMVKRNSNLPFPDLVKIDAEGLDLEVLKGASDLLGKTEIFLVEAAVFYKGMKNNMPRIIKFMEESGYNLFEITDLNRPFKPKVLWLIEMAFVKKGGIIDSYKIQS